MIFSRKKKKLIELLDESIKLGLRKIDSDNVNEFLKNREYGLAFDTIVCQMFEYDNEISQSFYDKVEKTALLLKIDPNDYKFLEKNIRNEHSIPIAVQDKIGEIISEVKNKKEN